MRTMLQFSVAVGVLAVILFILLMLQPEWLLSGLRKRSPEVLYSVDTQTPVVALTIDDGPDSTSSPLILDVLEKYGAHATFFLISEHIPGNEEIVQQMIAEGHELGNHLTVDEPSINLPLDEFEQALVEADDMLSKFTDVQWIRPGSGWYNEEMLTIIEKHGYRCALGSVYPYDPQIGLYWYSAQYVLWKAKPGAVIVLHDYDTRGYRTAKALEIILPELEERGYRIVTLSELIEIHAVAD